MFKKFSLSVVACMVIACGAVGASEHRAEAFPGMLCFDQSGCGRCEVCVKAQPYAPSGTCMAVAGCY